MNSEEIKRNCSMQEVLAKYGLRPNRAGFIRCPFHREKTASMKIYRDSYYCFGCGAHGDVFDFVQAMDGVSFREAFRELGGTYEYAGEPFREKISRYHAARERDMRRKRAESIQKQKKLNSDLIDIYRRWYRKSRPFSDAWAESYHALQRQLYLHEILNDPEVMEKWDEAVGGIR